MTALPPSQCWMYVREQNSALVKRKRGDRNKAVQFTSEKGNVTNLNTFKYSGLANDRTIAVDIGADGKVTMGLKTPKQLTKPAKLINTTPCHKNFRRVAKQITTQTSGKDYRADLTSMALARWSALHRLTKVQAGLKKKAKSKCGRKSKA